MFRSSVLAGSCSSCVLWRCPHFLRRWWPPPALMAYGEREEGVFGGPFSVSGCAGVTPVCVYFVLVVDPWSFHPRGVCSSGLGFVLPRHTLLVFVCARGHTTLALFVPSGLWSACLVAVVCSPVASGSLLSVSRGRPSYHHFSPLGLPIRYSLTPSLLRSAVLAASCSLCVLRRCPYFLQRWRPIECTCSGKEKGVVLVAVSWLVGALAPCFSCVFVSGGPCCVLSYILFGACGGIYVCRHTSCSSCALGYVVYVFCGGGALFCGVWFPPFGYVRVSLIPCFFPQCGRPRV